MECYKATYYITLVCGDAGVNNPLTQQCIRCQCAEYKLHNDKQLSCCVMYRLCYVVSCHFSTSSSTYREQFAAGSMHQPSSSFVHLEFTNTVLSSLVLDLILCCFIHMAPQSIESSYVVTHATEVLVNTQQCSQDDETAELHTSQKLCIAQQCTMAFEKTGCFCTNSHCYFYFIFCCLF